MNDERNAASGGVRYEALDSLRGILACGVVLFHLPAAGTIAASPVIRQGWLFVDFFFVLSGFVIAASYGEKLRRGFPLSAYMILRLGRLYPLHVVMLLIFLALDIAIYWLGPAASAARPPFAEPRTFSTFLGTLSLTEIFRPHSGFPWNGPSWSILAEVWTYFLTAVGLAALRDRFRFPLVTIMCASFVLLAAAPSGTLPWLPWTLIRCLLGFSIGMLAYELHLRLRGRAKAGGRLRATLAEIAVLVGAGAGMAALAPEAAQLACPFLFALVILVLAREQGAAAAILRLRPFRALGALSYSIYMVHWLVVVLSLHALPRTSRPAGGIAADALSLALLVTVILLAAISWRLVELPFRCASRALAERIARRPLAAPERVAPTM